MRSKTRCYLSVLLFLLGAACGDSESGTGADVGNSADAADTGPPVDTSGDDFLPQGCGDIPFTGTCAGNELRFCFDGELIRIDCDEVRANGVCFEVSTTYGFDCGVEPGGQCIEQRLIDGQPENVPQFCAGNEGGCVVGDAGAVCVENVGRCAEPFESPTCLDDVLVIDCQAGQPTGFDCAATGGRCAGTGACVDVGLGGPCDDTLLQCAAGLRCIIEEGLVGTCG